MGAGTRVGAIKFQASGWLAAAGLLLPGVLSAAGRHTDVHFALYGGYTIVAQGTVGRLKNLNFIIDTGAVPSVVDRRVARKLGLAGRAEQLSVFNRNLEAQRVVLPDLALGPLRARSVEILVTDLSAFERALGVPIAGMIGLDVLGSSDFSIDYATKTLSFGPLEMPASAGAIPFETGQGYVTVRFQVQERPVRLMVDTGARDLILFEDRVRGRLPGMRLVGQKVSANLAGKISLQRAELPEARLGATSLGDQRASLIDAVGEVPPDLDGLLGVASLGVRRIGFDFGNGILSWER